ncbi:glycosyltransferase [Candidatus Saccharibacteria bacterium]|nr:glycosyltransferase [Candidatus Saccharibacteria bacterium]
MNKSDSRFAFLRGTASKPLLLVNILLSIMYFIVITFFFEHGNPILFSLLIAGEVFHLWQIIGYCYTVWEMKNDSVFAPHFARPVDVFITVAGEPVEIIEETARAALAMDYPSFTVNILNDGYVAKKDNWQDVVRLGEELGINVITRTTPGGAKAGNINNALRETSNPYVVIFDADHVPYPSFLRETMGYFIDPKMGFVQTPQFYHNQGINGVTQVAWDQQSLFFGPIMAGKNRLGSVFMCGTNMVLAREALTDAGGMCEFNIAEDFLTSLFMHEKGWKSVYVPKVLAEGLAPEDFLSYYKQQYRWTRGSLEVIFKFNPLFRRGLNFKQKMQYLISASYYLSGVVVLIDALLPIIFLFTGLTAITTSTMTLALVFMPYIFVSLYLLQSTSNYAYTFQAISFSISSFFLQIRALIAVLLNQKTSFVVTSKQAIQGNFLYLVVPQIAYIVLTIAGSIVAFNREGMSASLLANLAWALVTVACFIPFIMAAAPKLSLPGAKWLQRPSKRRAAHQPVPVEHVS